MKANSYQHYFNAFWDVQQQAILHGTGSKEHTAAHDAYQKALHDVYVLGSDQVFLATADFHNYIAEHPTRESKDIDEVTKKYASVVIAMRKDGFQKTRLSNEEIRLRLKFEI